MIMERAKKISARRQIFNLSPPPPAALASVATLRRVQLSTWLMHPSCGPLCAHAASGTPGSDIQPIPCSYCSKARCTGEVTTQLANCTHGTLRVFPPHEHAATATHEKRASAARCAAPEKLFVIGYSKFLRTRCLYLPFHPFHCQLAFRPTIVITIPPSHAHIGGAGAGNFIRCSIFGVPGPKVMARASAVHNLPEIYGVPASEEDLFLSASPLLELILDTLGSSS
ncbi:hypothetical protein B0H11DRAFT_1912970 [Mycena galericulata]|nr:hypothetical protein B0H11DRAFT_1912970 [Mycena galericulata]